LLLVSETPLDPTGNTNDCEKRNYRATDWRSERAPGRHGRPDWKCIVCS